MAVADELAWLPKYPHLPPPKYRVAPGAQTFLVQRYDPPPPDLGWAPITVDLTLPRRRSQPEWWVSAPLYTAAASVAWLPIAPHFAPVARPQPIAPTPTYDHGFFIAVATRGAWRPLLPQPLPRAAAAPSLTLVWPLRQGPWPCVSLRIDGQTPTSLVSLDATAPAMLDVAQTGTALIAIGFC